MLFNPANVSGLNTSNTIPNTLTFSGSNAIIVTDSDYSSAGPAETTTVSVTGSALGSYTAVGSLSATGTNGATVSGGGTSTLTITGSPLAITETLATMTYQPGPGFYGTTTMTVSTDDNGNSGSGGPATDTRTLPTITVVGLFEGTIYVPEDTGTGTSQTNAAQYIEVFSTVPSYTIPSNVYFVAVNGSTNSSISAGQVQDVISLGGLTTGSDGYLALLEAANPYSGGAWSIRTVM